MDSQNESFQVKIPLKRTLVRMFLYLGFWRPGMIGVPLE